MSWWTDNGFQPLTATQTGAPTSIAGPAGMATLFSGGSTPTLGQFSGSMTPDQVGQLVSQYSSAAGLPADTQYWTNAWNQWGQNDPNYFRTRLINGLASQGGSTTAFGAPSATAAGGWGPGTAGWSGAGGGAATGGGGGGLGADPASIMQQDPGYQFTLDQAMRAVQNSAAAKGTLLTGGTLKDMAGYAGGLANQTFNNIFQRNLSLANLGASAAGGMGSLGSTYGSQAGNLITGAGAAQAAGQMGQANAIGGGLNNIGNLAMFYGLMNNNSSPYGGASMGPAGGGYYQGGALVPGPAQVVT